MTNLIIMSTAHPQASMGGTVGAGQHHANCRGACLWLGHVLPSLCLPFMLPTVDMVEGLLSQIELL